MEITDFSHLPFLSKEKTPKIEFEFQDLGLSMQSYFPVNERSFLWSLFYKFPLAKLREAFKVCQAKDIKSTRYLVGVVKNLK